MWVTRLKNRKLARLACAIVLALACSNCTRSSKDRAEPLPIPVILDTDIGDDIDDTWALGFLLRSPELDLRLAVGDNGKALYRAKLLAKFLESVGHGAIPVGIGLEVPQPAGERQGAWTVDYDLDRYPGKVHRDGIQAIIDTIMHSPRRVTVIAIGPLQNIAAALKREPRIAKRARFVGMQGSIRVGYGNDPQIAAEYNVKFAPEACQTAFAAPWDVTITPLDTCDRLALIGDKYQRVLHAKDPIASAILANYWLWSVAGGQPFVDAYRQRSSTLFDVVAVYLAFDDAWCGMEDLGIRVSADGFTLEDAQAKKLHVAMTWKNLPALEDLLVRRISRPR